MLQFENTCIRELLRYWVDADKCNESHLHMWLSARTPQIEAFLNRPITGYGKWIAHEKIKQAIVNRSRDGDAAYLSLKRD